MVNPVSSLSNRFPPLPQEDPSYALHYSQPRLTMGKPVNLIWEQKVETFSASDDTAAHKKMLQMLEQNPVSFKGETYKRELTRFVRNHPQAVLRESKVTNVGRVLQIAKS